MYPKNLSFGWYLWKIIKYGKKIGEKNDEPIFCDSSLLYPKIVFREPIPLLLYYVSFDGWRNFLRKVIKNSTHNTFIFFGIICYFVIDWLIFSKLDFHILLQFFLKNLVKREFSFFQKMQRRESCLLSEDIYILYSGIPVLSGSSRSTFHTELELQGGILLPGYILFWIMHPSTT